MHCKMIQDFTFISENLKINISVQIEDILDLDEIKGLMKAKFTVKLNWLDRYTKYVNLSTSNLFPMILDLQQMKWILF